MPMIAQADMQDSRRFDRIKTRPAYEQVAEAIEQTILSGRLRPGEDVLVQAAGQQAG